MRSYIVGAAIFLGFAATGAALSTLAQQPTRSTITQAGKSARAAKVVERDACSGNGQPSIVVELDLSPERARDGSWNGEIIFSSDLEDPAGAAWRFEVMDDRGSIRSGPLTDVVSPSPRGTPQRVPVTLSSALPDGYYLARVAVAAVTTRQETAAEGEVYFQLSAGELVQLDATTWYQNSRANEAM
jgi:hypothetical protein